MTTINELAATAGELNRSMNAKAGLNPYSPVVFALASGLDIAITVFEYSTGARVNQMSEQSAMLVVGYLNDEAKRMNSVDQQIAFFYSAWAQVLSDQFVKR
jgi:hypothetical protein